MFSKSVTLAQYDPDLAAAIAQEDQRQQDHVELIASENYVSCAVMETQGSQLTNKYAEGYPGKRYYGGCEYVDIVEQLAIDRVKKLFGAQYANVQPHSGSQANQAVYASVLKPGDTILGMSLAHGGHLTHGASVNISGKLYNAVTYGLDENEVLDYAEVERLALEHKPKMIVAGASAYALQIDWAKFREIADKVGAYLFVDMAHYAGLIAGGEYPNPVPFCDFVVSGRTESHVFLVDLQPMKITGKAAEAALGKAHITVNKNAIPNDPEKPFVTSGIRIGSAAMTTRGFNEADARVLANLVADVLSNPEDEANLAKVREQVTALCNKYPVYGA